MLNTKFEVIATKLLAEGQLNHTTIHVTDIAIIDHMSCLKST